MTDPPPAIARLAPLLPELAIALRQNRGEIPASLQKAGNLGGRHVAMLVSISVAGSATVSELADRLGMSVAHASLVIGELADAGLVEREHDPRDRRRVVVSIADAAKPAVAEMRLRSAAPLRRFLRELDPDDADLFIDRLARLVEILRSEP